MRRSPRRHVVAAVGLFALLAATSAPSGATRRFFDDDPLGREPDTQDASKVTAWTIEPVVDLIINLFSHPGDPAPDVRARNVNTIDEVPDSSWFTNRILARPVTLDELARGPLTDEGPAPGVWTVVSPNLEGAAPDLTVRDARNTVWLVSFDAAGYPEAATGAIAVATRIFWALGYWQTENYLVTMDPKQLVIAESAVVTPPSGKQRRMRESDLQAILRKAHRSQDGTYRAIASRAVPGRTVGGFSYYGTRPDDPNDVIPHEHRRELRALKVFGAWTNFVDMTAGNTLDSVIAANGRGVIRHYLHVDSAFGTGTNGPHEYFEGWEYLHDGELVRKRLLRLGFVFAPWQTIRYEEVPAIGRFEGEQFDPRSWRPRAPTAAFLRARADDDFWAARRVATFTDEMIRTAVHVGRYSAPEAERHLADVLIQRRQKIASAYLASGQSARRLRAHARRSAQFWEHRRGRGRRAAAPPNGYRASWARFDNTSGATSPLGSVMTFRGTAVAAPTLPATAGAFVRVEISAVEPAPRAWTTPVSAYFRKSASGWTLVGLERN